LFWYNPYPHGYKNLVMEVHVWVQKGKCFHTRTSLVLDIGSNSRRIFGFAWHACIIYSSLLLKLVQGWKNLSSYLVLLWVINNRYKSFTWGGGGEGESFNLLLNSIVYTTSVSPMPIFCNKIRESDSTKAMKCSKCLITHFTESPLSRQDKCKGK
jgi:hypothetical protein